MNFQRTIESSCTNDGDKLLYLQQYTSGRAKKLVESCSHYDQRAAYAKAVDLLLKEYGNEFKVSNAYIQKLENWPPIKNEDPRALEDLSIFLMDCFHYLDNMTIRNQLQSPKEIQAIVNKLPYKMRDRWRRKCHNLVTCHGGVYFKHLVDFVAEESSVLNQPLYGNINDNPATSKKVDKPKRKILTVQSQKSTESSKTDSSKGLCDYCNQQHHVSSCHSLSKLNSNDKSNFIKKERLCFGCLNKGHMSKTCRKRLTCDKCHLKHPTVLHDPTRERKPNEVVENRRIEAETSKACSIRGNENCKKILSPILAVKLKVNNHEVIINCALDSCASDCWMNEKLLPLLNLHPSEKTISVSTMEARNRSMTTRVVNNVTLTDLDETNSITIPVVFTKPDNAWPFTEDDLVTYNDVENLNHLSSVPFSFSDASIDLLVGLNVPELLKPLQVVDGAPDEPYASKHALGWALNGPVNRKGSKYCNRISTSESIYLDDKIEKYFSKDFVDNSDVKTLSNEDKIWLESVDNNTRKLSNGHLEIDLPLKDDAKFPYNRSQIYGQFIGLKKRFDKDTNLFEDYKEFMENMLANNFAEKVPDDELDSDTSTCWYLSHHPVFHKRKNKLRIVFNCSLKYKGTSLNANLLQGPDLTNALFGVLVRFRQEPVAIVGDIRKMFYQVNVPKNHSNLMRFFWFDETMSDIVEYRLKVHVFGATSSPSIANYALKRTVNTPCSAEAKSSILNNFYVDDLLKSTNNVTDAVNLLNEIRTVIQSCGFHLTSFNSNSSDILSKLPVEELSKTAQIHDLCNDDSSALGIVWNTVEDTFSFKVNYTEHDIITKRILLKTLASVYDPLGLVSPFLMQAKKLFQVACSLHIHWDDVLPPELFDAWEKWLSDLRTLYIYKIPRCLKQNNVKLLELHLFCDGSEKAYGTVAYLRSIEDDYTSNSSLIASKSRVTPINNSTLKTVPRIELCSAKLAIELSQKLQNELEYKFSLISYWSDSTTVLNYIKSESARFHRFVSNKVSYIRCFSDPSQWQYIPSKENPADMVTRGATPEKLKNSVLWNKGPEFLRNDSYPKQDYPKVISTDDLEIKENGVLLVCKTIEDSPVDVLMNSCSSWFKLTKRIAALIQLIDSFRHRQNIKNSKVTLKFIKSAEIKIISHIQRKYYSNEIRCIKSGSNIPKNSALRKLHPLIDDHGCLRVGGRLENSTSSFDIKHPIILPPCYISELLIQHIHSTVGHLGRESILAALRKRYWIIKANSMARKIVNSCVICKKLQGKTGEQIMANLPTKRLTGDVPVFTNTAVDYFGPFLVVHGRRTLKRYGVIFTCLNSRALHLEVSDSLTTDSFINALRRFLSRRGNVKSMTSDNGTNLVGGNTELKVAIQGWNQAAIGSWMIQSGIEWQFNPPHASHFGGIYEREIRSVRKVFNALLNSQNIKLNDDQLNTLMCEVECILNNRPLTEISSDPTDLEALTPNHLLLLNNSITFPPGLFSKEDIYLRRRWKQVQYLSDNFWKKWSNQYLILLQERQKWHVIRPNFKVNDLVLVVDILLPRNCWPLGRITEVKCDKYNNVRSAFVKISKCKNSSLSNFETSVIHRPITKLVKLLSL